jgi:hypothetical protein
LFFWQASQEVEDVEATPKRDPLKYAPHQAESALGRIRLDTYVPVMVLMMLLTANTKIMGQFTVTGVLRFTGWLATAVMAAAVAGMLVTAGV